MKKIIIFLLVASLAFSCSIFNRLPDNKADQENVSVEANDGLSFETAIVINQKNEYRGTNAEYKWLKQHYPEYKLKEQSVSFYNNKPYDIFIITTKDGETRSIYFDITNFYGNIYRNV